MINIFLNILKNISEIIADSKNYPATMAEITRCLATTLDAKSCSIFTFVRDHEALELTATYGLNEKYIGKIRLKSGEGLVGTCFLENKVINIVNPEFHPKYKFVKEAKESSYKAFLAVPLTIAAKCIGVIILQNDKQIMFNEVIVETLKSLSFQLANVVLNADILQRLADSAEKEKDGGTVEKQTGPKTISGINGNSGITIGKAYIFNPFNSFKEIKYSYHNNLKKELEILEKALKQTIEKTLGIQKKALSLISEADASIFYAHILFLEDKALINRIKQEITDNGLSAEMSVKIVYKEYKKRFIELKDDIFKDKIMDLKDALLRLVETIHTIKENTTGKTGMEFKNIKNIILVAREILPSDMLKIPTENINGIICEKGGIAAHIAILAKAFDIPALMQAEKATAYINNNDDTILDCYSGTAYVRPDDRTLKHFQEVMKSKTYDIETCKGSKKPAMTKDNVRIKVMANLALMSETKMLEECGAEGIGLYRTEFLYMIRDRLPSESELIKIFSQLVREVKDKELTIRVLDVGSDKPLPYIDSEKEENPALGCRGIRYLLSNPEILKTHLKAILKACVDSRLKILFPMISSRLEITQVKKILKEVEYELDGQNMKHNKSYSTGVMIEVPSALLDLENIIKDVDFVSIGTNDLLQYIFAIDRSNENISYRDFAYDPVFLKLLKNIGKINSSIKEKCISICGEMAGNILAVPFIIGSGIYELSMPPKFIPPIKKVLMAFTTEECSSILDKAVRMSGKEEVRAYISEELKKRKISLENF